MLFESFIYTDFSNIYTFRRLALESTKSLASCFRKPPQTSIPARPQVQKKEKNKPFKRFYSCNILNVQVFAKTEINFAQ